MMTTAALLVLNVAIENFSSAYAWSWLTALGVTIVSRNLVLDVAAKQC